MKILQQEEQEEHMIVRIIYIERTMDGVDYVDIEDCNSFEAGPQWVRVYTDPNRINEVAVFNSSIVRMVELYDPDEVEHVDLAIQ